jgi:hypothetical protein
MLFRTKFLLGVWTLFCIVFFLQCFSIWKRLPKPRFIVEPANPVPATEFKKWKKLGPEYIMDPVNIIRIKGMESRSRKFYLDSVRGIWIQLMELGPYLPPV